MKKVLLIAILAAFLGAVAAYFSGINSDENSDNTDSVATSQACDLNKEDCEIINAGGDKITFSIYPRPLEGMVPLEVKISGLKGLIAPELWIEGINMDMGVIKAKMTKRGENWAANVVISLCVLEKMEYKMRVMDANSQKAAIGFYIKG